MLGGTARKHDETMLRTNSSMMQMRGTHILGLATLYTHQAAGAALILQYVCYVTPEPTVCALLCVGLSVAVGLSVVVALSVCR